MRKSKQSAAQLEEMALAEDRRRTKRNGAFQVMKIRDRGWVVLRDIKGSEVIMIWGTPELDAANCFKLRVHGKEVVLDAEEFRRFLRWV